MKDALELIERQKVEIEGLAAANNRTLRLWDSGMLSLFFLCNFWGDILFIYFLILFDTF